MRRLFIFLAIGTILMACEKQKEQIESFAFDNSQIQYRDVHRYTFSKNGKVQVDRETSFRYVAGLCLDSTITETIFAYNDKGQLISAIDLPDSSKRIKIYNDLDSLISDFRINGFGDTTRLTINLYDGSRLIRTMSRYLDMNLPESFEKPAKKDLRNYDTTVFISDLIYEDDTHIKSLKRDKTGALTEEIELFYEKDKVVKSITYAFLGDAKYIKETTFYSGNDHSPDFVSIDTQGDTIAFIKTFNKDDGRVVLSRSKEFDLQDISYYDMNGQLMAFAYIDSNSQSKTVTRYYYDDKGNIVEEITYRQQLNDAQE
jgi:YD repeat-containing protein